MTHARSAHDLLSYPAAFDLPQLAAHCSDLLNRLARQPVRVRRGAVADDSPHIELLFGMDQAVLSEIDDQQWLRTEHDRAGCTDLIQQLKALFTLPAAAALEVGTAQRPA